MSDLEKDVPCTFCGHTVVGSRFLACDLCDVPIHADCWELNGKCPAYGCGSTRAVDPALALYRKVRTAVVIAPDRPKTELVARDPKTVEERVALLERHMTDHSRRAIKAGLALVSVVATLVGALILWPHGVLPFIVPPLLVLVAGTAALMSSPDHQRYRALRHKLDELRSLQLEHQLDAELKRDRVE